jgi:MFS family permease
MAIAVALVTVGAFLFAATTGFGTLVLAQIVLAVGAAFGFVGAGYIGSKWFVAAKYGLMFGLVQMFASLGSAVGQPVISALLKDMTWEQLLAGFGAFGVLLTIAFIFVVRNPTPSAEEVAEASEEPSGNVIGEILHDLRACFGNSQVVLSALFAGASFGTMLAVGVLWGPRVQEARVASAGFAAVLSALAWLGLAFGAPLVNVVSNHWHSRKWPAVVGMFLQTIAVTLFIYGPNNGRGASMVVMFAVGLFAGTHMLGFTIAGESVSAGLIGSASAIVNGICFIVGGILEAVPGWLLPDAAQLSDFHHVLWVMPAVLVLGGLAALSLKESTSRRSSPGRRSRHAVDGRRRRTADGQNTQQLDTNSNERLLETLLGVGLAYLFGLVLPTLTPTGRQSRPVISLRNADPLRYSQRILTPAKPRPVPPRSGACGRPSY